MKNKVLITDQSQKMNINKMKFLQNSDPELHKFATKISPHKIIKLI